jgi:carbon storage regulator CsrA
MLVLTRKVQEQIQIGHNIKVTIVRVKGHSVRLGIEAPDNVRIVRGELAAAMAEFRDDEDTSEEGQLANGDFADTAPEPSDAMLSADEEDETVLTDAVAQTSASQLPFGRTPGDRRACQLRRPPRLGPASLRRMSCR